MRIVYYGLEIDLLDWLYNPSGYVSFGGATRFYRDGLCEGVPWQWYFLKDNLYPDAKPGDTLPVPKLWRKLFQCNAVWISPELDTYQLD